MGFFLDSLKRLKVKAESDSNGTDKAKKARRAEEDKDKFARRAEEDRQEQALRGMRRTKRTRTTIPIIR